MKSFLQVTIYALEVVLPNEAHTQTRRRHEGSLSFRSFGDVCRIPATVIGFSLTIALPPIAIHCAERRIRHYALNEEYWNLYREGYRRCGSNQVSGLDLSGKLG